MTIARYVLGRKKDAKLDTRGRLGFGTRNRVVLLVSVERTTLQQFARRIGLQAIK